MFEATCSTPELRVRKQCYCSAPSPLCRARMRPDLSSPVADIHYSASHNNYPKLLFYTQKYPEMLNELDHDGSTSALLLSLHLSASLYLICCTRVRY